MSESLYDKIVIFAGKVLAGIEVNKDYEHVLKKHAFPEVKHFVEYVAVSCGVDNMTAVEVLDRFLPYITATKSADEFITLLTKFWGIAVDMTDDDDKLIKIFLMHKKFAAEFSEYLFGSEEDMSVYEAMKFSVRHALTDMFGRIYNALIITAMNDNGCCGAGEE